MNEEIVFYHIAFNIKEQQGEIQIKLKNGEFNTFNSLNPETYTAILTTLKSEVCFWNGKHISTANKNE